MAPLVVCASPRECVGLDPSPIVLGVGKAAAAVGMTRALAEAKPSFVILFGVCGAYPLRHRDDDDNATLAVGDLCLVGEEVFGDEGVLAEEGFRSIEDLGLGERGPFAADPRLTADAANLLRAPVVRGATVSTCSGTDARSRAVAHLTRAQVETMEGAAVALACRAAGVSLLQLRCVSNMTGDRKRAGWHLEGAVSRVQEALRSLLEDDELGAEA
jgi:futalosine hydrolase